MACRAEGNEYFGKGQLAEAVQAYTRAVDTDEEDKHLALLNRSLVRLKLDQPAEALKDAEAAVDASPEGSRWLKGQFRLAQLQSLAHMVSQELAAVEGASKAKAILIRPGRYSSLQELLNLMQDFDLQSVASPPDEVAEKREICRRLGWRDAVELCKFYDDQGTDGWYFYTYGNPAEKGAGVLQGMKQIKRHMIVTRSGPTGAEYELEVTRMEVAKALWQFRTEDPEQVFQERERSRFTRKFMGGRLPDGMIHRSVRLDPSTGMPWRPPR